jgi:hypothetical protein
MKRFILNFLLFNSIFFLIGCTPKIQVTFAPGEVKKDNIIVKQLIEKPNTSLESNSISRIFGYNYTTTNKYIYNDDIISVEFFFVNNTSPYCYYSLVMTLKNLSDDLIYINWQQAYIIDNVNNTIKIFPGAYSLATGISNEQNLKTPVGPQAVFRDNIMNVHSYINGKLSFDRGVIEYITILNRPHQEIIEQSKTNGIQLLLPLEINNKIIKYLFKFNIIEMKIN